ncbi:hypothetical protein JCM19240_6273 [Vibrio maritimus]|uniref:Uncharacterized protein n=1 Tax=Vibrio maritimus TaxID=990268 RepID=A0A090SYT7_9VIBR|nr:hypothetical protein JCM19240_6273 [Vibrio maritimus]
MHRLACISGLSKGVAPFEAIGRSVTEQIGLAKRQAILNTDVSQKRA